MHRSASGPPPSTPSARSCVPKRATCMGSAASSSPRASRASSQVGSTPPVSGSTYVPTALSQTGRGLAPFDSPRSRMPATRSPSSAGPCGRRACASRTTPRARRSAPPTSPSARPCTSSPRTSPTLGHTEGYLEAKAKAIVLLMRLLPEDLERDARASADWSYDGIVAYSKVCTHVGCPVALYEQQTHHLLCPCHQSQFDVANGAAVIFGPGRPSAAAAADHGRRRGLPHRAQRLHRARRPELLGAPLSTSTHPTENLTESRPSRKTWSRCRPARTASRSAAASSAPPRTTSTSAPASRASSRSSAARSSPTTGRSCSARSRCGASSSSCSRARS